MILFTQSTAVLHKYLNDELKYFVCYNFSLRLHRIPWVPMSREIPEYSKFSRFVATLHYYVIELQYWVCETLAYKVVYCLLLKNQNFI